MKISLKKVFVKRITVVCVMLLTSCLMVLDQYLEPIKKRQTNSKKTIKIEGFVAERTSITPCQFKS